MTDGNMYGHAMWAGHWLWMLVMAISVSQSEIAGNK